MSRAHGSSGQTPSGHQGGAAHPLNWNPAESNPDQLMRDEILGYGQAVYAHAAPTMRVQTWAAPPPGGHIAALVYTDPASGSRVTMQYGEGRDEKQALSLLYNEVVELYRAQYRARASLASAPTESSEEDDDEDDDEGNGTNDNVPQDGMPAGALAPMNASAQQLMGRHF